MDAGAKIELDDVASLDLAIARTADGVAAGFPGENVLRQTLILRSLSIDDLLRHAGNLKLSQTWLEPGDDAIGGGTRNAESFLQAGDFRWRFDGPLLKNNIIGLNDLGGGKGFPNRCVHWERKDGPASQSNFLRLFADGFSNKSTEIVDLDRRIIRLRRLAIFNHLSDIGNLGAAFRKSLAFRPDEELGAPLGCNKNPR